MQTKNTKQGGFTLVEIAIVLVIIGLLLGGILKGQELINNAKVRSVADRQNSLKAAWFGFIDRYNFIPGDSTRAVQLVPNAVARTDVDNPGDGRLTLGESVVAMQHLTGAGFLRCPQCNGGTAAASAGQKPTAENSLVNQYSGVMSIWNEESFYAERSRSGTANARASGRLQIHSGPRIPSNILSEVDRKIDDGVANTGDLVFNGFDPTFTGDEASIGRNPSYSGAPDEPSFADCTNSVNLTTFEVIGVGDGQLKTTQADTLWRTSNRDPSVENNCGASVFI